MQTIVVGFDGSDTARKAVAEASELARSTGAELHLVYVVDGLPGSGRVSATSHEDALAAAEATNQDEIAESLRDVSARSVVLAGPAAGCMLDHSNEVDADVIVVGNRRVQGLDRLLGSVALEVLRHANCSVYVAHTT